MARCRHVCGSQQVVAVAVAARLQVQTPVPSTGRGLGAVGRLWQAGAGVLRPLYYYLLSVSVWSIEPKWNPPMSNPPPNGME